MISSIIQKCKFIFKEYLETATVLILLSIVIVMVLSLIFQSCSNENLTKTNQDTFIMKGTYLTDPCGDTVILKGVNKMSIFDMEDPYGENYFPEIAKTNANCVRIVWQKNYSNGKPSRHGQLDTLIRNCIDAKMIPIVEMHDATCNWSELDNVVNTWTSSDILTIVKKYQHAMMVNIANEAGDYSVTANQYVTSYQNAITKLRNAGINTPLIIDAPDCGKNLELIVPLAAGLTAYDPNHNILFSTHPYWSITDGATPTFIKNQLDNAANNNVPFILGELCAYGGWPGDGQNISESCGSKGAVDYSSLLSESATHKIGWLVWEWGPGNGFYDQEPVVLCPAMDMTTNGKYQTIVDIAPGDVNAWVKDIVITNPLGIQKSAHKTDYILNGFKCIK